MKYAAALAIAIVMMTAQAANASWVMTAAKGQSEAPACPATFEMAYIDFQGNDGLLICLPGIFSETSDERSEPSGDDDTDFADAKNAVPVQAPMFN